MLFSKYGNCHLLKHNDKILNFVNFRRDFVKIGEKNYEFDQTCIVEKTQNIAKELQQKRPNCLTKFSEFLRLERCKIVQLLQNLKQPAK